MEIEQEFVCLIRACLDAGGDLLDRELQVALSTSLGKAAKENNRLLAVRLSARVSANVLKLGLDAPKELIALSAFIQKEEANYKKGILWSSIFPH
ncbi:MAG: bacteriocin immunity protein [Candidatus Saccharibacteria bacterium]|nr:bacteriocin immunity protein [Candidatus Saccharibacteria bacterium]